MNKEMKIMGDVKNMVEYMKDEVDKAIAILTKDGKIDKVHTDSVSGFIKSTIDSTLVKASQSIQKAASK